MPIIQSTSVTLGALELKKKIHPPAYNLIPSNVDQALRTSPRGVRARVKLAVFYGDKYKNNFQIQVIPGLIPDRNNPGAFLNDHGITFYGNDPLKNNVTIQVTTSNFPAPDRMNNWTPQELIHIITCHELAHVVRKKFPRRLRVDESVPPGIANTDPHERAFNWEFMARIEYSIFQPGISTPRATWLPNYQAFFGTIPRLVAIGRTGAQHCQLLYWKVLERINNLYPTAFSKHPSIAPATIINIQNNYNNLILPANTYFLVP